MADVEEPQFNSLAERIAALNKQKNFNAGSGGGAAAATEQPVKKRPPPPPPPSSSKLAAQGRSQTVPPIQANGFDQRASTVTTPSSTKTNPPPLPRRDTQASLSDASTQNGNGGRPPLPTRTSTSQQSPALPPRRPSAQPSLSARRNSASSEVSQLSTVSTLSMGRTASSNTTQGSDGALRKLPPAFDPASLPPLPPTKRELEARALEAAANNAAIAEEPAARTRPASSFGRTDSASSARPSLPPRLPSRPAKQQNQTPTQPETNGSPQINAARRKVPVGIVGFQSGQKQTPPRSQSQLQGQADESQQERPPPMPKRRTNDDAPPPIPLSSRPSAAQIEAVSTRSIAKPAALNDCWICRDWSGPDNVAAQFPRQSLPRNDPVGHLARGLCDPFPSYTDKARAIFTWFHHNIYYDTVSFFNNNIKHMSVEDTIFSGLAVCQGYAETYAAIAKRAGLECIVVGGHGKGYGHTALKKGERPPPAKPDGHAWNAVRIDGGEWKLLDACWGAGHLDGNSNEYKQVFTSEEFIRPNDKFGRTHFPKNPQHQFRNDGRTISWEEYFVGRVDGETPICYTNAKQEGIAEDSIEPKERHIRVNSGEVVRFQFSKICEHWRSETHGLGKPPLLLLSIHGLDGRKDDMVPFETDGYWHWADVNARDLGAPGQSVEVTQITTINDQDARGVSAREYFEKKGRVGMSWAYVMRWELV